MEKKRTWGIQETRKILTYNTMGIEKMLSNGDFLTPSSEHL